MVDLDAFAYNAVFVAMLRAVLQLCGIQECF